MKRRGLIVLSLSVACLLAPSAVFATPHIYSPVHAMFGKTKIVKFTLLNDSTSTMELKVGDDLVKLDAGKSLDVKLPVGALVLANNETPSHQVGSVIAQASDSLSGAIVHIK